MVSNVHHMDLNCEIPSERPISYRRALVNTSQDQFLQKEYSKKNPPLNSSSEVSEGFTEN
jgi:hypothetical protein